MYIYFYLKYILLFLLTIILGYIILLFYPLKSNVSKSYLIQFFDKNKDLINDSILIGSLILLVFKLSYLIVFSQISPSLINILLLLLFSFFSYAFNLIDRCRDLIISLFSFPEIIPTISLYTNYQHFENEKKLSYDFKEWGIDNDGFLNEPDHYNDGDIPLPENKLYKTYFHNFF